MSSEHTNIQRSILNSTRSTKWIRESLNVRPRGAPNRRTDQKGTKKYLCAIRKTASVFNVRRSSSQHPLGLYCYLLQQFNQSFAAKDTQISSNCFVAEGSNEHSMDDMMMTVERRKRFECHRASPHRFHAYCLNLKQHNESFLAKIQQNQFSLCCFRLRQLASDL